MKSNRSIYSILFLFWLDVFTLSVVSLTIFFFIGKNFYISFLGFALSLRTLSSALSSYMMNTLVSKIGTKKLLYVIQTLSLFTILVLSIAVYEKNQILILVGVSLLGLPYVMKNVLITIYFKVLYIQDDEFRKHSGSREFIFGLARFLGCFISPFFFFYTSIYKIFIIISLGMILSLIFVRNLHITDLSRTNDKLYASQNISLLSVFKKISSWEYILKSSSILILVSYIALLSTSNHLSFSSSIPEILRQLLWSLEAFMMIIGSLIYIKYKQYFEKSYIKIILICNSFCMLPLIYCKSISILILISTLLSLLIMMGFYSCRDDYVLSAKNDDHLIRGFSSFSSAHQYLIYTISPLFLSFLFMKYSFHEVIVIIFIIQLSFLLLVSVTNHFKNKIMN